MRAVRAHNSQHVYDRDYTSKFTLTVHIIPKDQVHIQAASHPLYVAQAHIAEIHGARRAGPITEAATVVTIFPGQRRPLGTSWPDKAPRQWPLSMCVLLDNSVA